MTKMPLKVIIDFLLTFVPVIDMSVLKISLGGRLGVRQRLAAPIKAKTPEKLENSIGS